MARNFSQLASDLVGMFAGTLPLPYAEVLINQAWRDICDERHWSFLRQKGIYHAPASITTGSVQVVKGSKIVTFDVTARTALAAADSDPLLIKRQFYVTAGDFYNISDTSNLTINGQVTLDRIFRGNSNATSNYTVARFYYGLPEDGDGNAVADFKTFLSVINQGTNTPFLALNKSIQDLDHIDPNRNTVGEPYELYPYMTDTAGNPIWEMYPHPVADAVYIVNYIARFTEKSGTDTFPMIIPTAMITARAGWYACDWAMANRGTYPTLKDTNWFQQKQNYLLMYSNPNPRGLALGLLEKAMREDEEMYPVREIIDTSEFYPIGDDERIGFYSIDVIRS